MTEGRIYLTTSSRKRWGKSYEQSDQTVLDSRNLHLTAFVTLEEKKVNFD